MLDQDPSNEPEPTRLASALILLGGFLFGGNNLTEITDDTLEELRDLIDFELVSRRGMIH
ncbi:uncharacterized protein METZ01_LOCUS208889 [marine metagenome]|uniref:Uncharacterized protein n=1 Tax=marine metagenome TaxID=408172 RepID=A0A382F016_9ZZZZ